MLKSIFEACIYLLQETLSKLKGTSEVFMRLLSHVIELVMECARPKELLTTTTPSGEMDVVTASFSKVSDYMGDFIASVIGKPFGLGLKGRDWSQSQAESEIKVS